MPGTGVRVKLAVTGKGGVGKTTFTSLLAKAYNSAGRRVLVVDADPNATLAACLGFPEPDSIPPLNQMDDLIEERTGGRPGSRGSMYKLNPKVDDIVERFAVTHDGISLLRMGEIKIAGSGCYCPENAFLKSLAAHLLLTRRDVLLLDMEAGVEHFGRATAQCVDWLLTVVQPTRQSVETARRICGLAKQIGISRIGAVGNGVRDEDDAGFVLKSVDFLPLLGVVPYDEALRAAEREGSPPETDSVDVNRTISRIMDRLNEKAGDLSEGDDDGS